MFCYEHGTKSALLKEPYTVEVAMSNKVKNIMVCNVKNWRELEELRPPYVAVGDFLGDPEIGIFTASSLWGLPCGTGGLSHMPKPGWFRLP